MGEITAIDGEAEGAGTKINKFLANRGVIIIRESREIGAMKCDYSAKLTAESIILATAKSSTKVSQKSFGIRLETTDSDSRTHAAHLDFDESEEFSNAITFIHEASQRIAGQQRDYTEATFSTKDQIQIGFFQNTDQSQKAFIRLTTHSGLCFIPIASLPSVKKMIEAARAHLIKKGAGADGPTEF